MKANSWSWLRCALPPIIGHNKYCAKRPINLGILHHLVLGNHDFQTKNRFCLASARKVNLPTAVLRRSHFNITKFHTNPSRPPMDFPASKHGFLNVYIYIYVYTLLSWLNTFWHWIGSFFRLQLWVVISCVCTCFWNFQDLPETQTEHSSTLQHTVVTVK